MASVLATAGVGIEKHQWCRIHLVDRRTGPSGCRIPSCSWTKGSWAVSRRVAVEDAAVVDVPIEGKGYCSDVEAATEYVAPP